MTQKDNCSGNEQVCNIRITGIHDTMGLLSGKWKVHILGTLLYKGKLRFMDLKREVKGIAPKMLSKELQDLELNQLVSRTVLQTKPITVEYEVTAHGKTLEPIIDEIANWGIQYRRLIQHSLKVEIQEPITEKTDKTA